MIHVCYLRDDTARAVSREIGLPEGESASLREVMNRYAQLYILPVDREFFLQELADERLRERLAAEGSFSVTFRCKPRDGSVAYVSMTVSRAGGGESAVLAFRDMTDGTRTQQREMIRRMTTELEREKRANEIKSRFLFNISHDIRTLMNVIVGFTGLARRHAGEAERLSEALDRVEKADGQLMELIGDLLDMSALQYGRVQIKAEPCRLRDELGAVFELFRTQAQEKGIAMNLATELPDEDVLLDANRFRRILENLLSNAIQFADAGGSITLAARRQRASDSGYGRYEFKISDSGVGMSEKFMEHIFDDERGEDVATTEMGGMGLGLSIVKGLVDMMGGSITARSEKDVGTTFTVCLPLKLARHGAGSVEEPPAADCRACGECRALPREDAQSLPIIALSANARDEDRRMSMESGMNSRVAKPFDFARLIETVNEHIGQRESPRV